MVVKKKKKRAIPGTVYEIFSPYYPSSPPLCLHPWILKRLQWDSCQSFLYSVRLCAIPEEEKLVKGGIRTGGSGR